MDGEVEKSRKERIINWCKEHRRWSFKILLITVACLIGFYGICVALSYKAADIFNTVVAERELFPGTVTVDRLSATPLGEVTFEGLIWKNKDDVLLASIPEGSFKVRLWDVVAQRIGTTTVTELNIEEGSYVHLFLNDNMELQNIKEESKTPKKKEEKPKNTNKNSKIIQITGLTGNKKFICKVNIHDGKIEAESPSRHFIINKVNLRSDINTGAKSKIDLTAGHFDGTIDADALSIGGTLDFSKPVPEYDMYLAIKDCNPKSLDVGVDIDDEASVYSNIRGNLPKPVIDGTLTMDKLDITALSFTNLKGYFHYEDGKLNAQEVTATVFGGTVEASGNFDLDEKSYQADLKGTDLKGGVAAHDMFLKCKVDLDLHMKENKKQGTKEIYGSFYSGPGRYHILPFNKISGSFEQNGKTLLFKDVVISLAMGDITTDAFSIINGKVHLGPIYVESDGNRSLLK